MDKIWETALEIAPQSNCKKRLVACIITDENETLISTGYNWHEDGVCDCDTTKTATHAEIMAINNIPIYNRNDDLYAYITHEPCERCSTILHTVCKEVKVKELSPILSEVDMAEWGAEHARQTDAEILAKIQPKHYSDVDGVPSIKFFESASRSREGYQDYLHLTSLKYVYRLWNKDEPEVNIGKAEWFLTKLKESLNGPSN